MLTSALLLHVCCAAAALLSGYLAIVLRKGSGLHGAAGTLFSVSMILASGAGAWIAGFLRPNSANLIGSTLTFYLCTTAWVTARRKDGRSGLFDLVALLFVLAIVTFAGIEAFGGATDATFYLTFGSIALLFAISDIRMIARGGVFGAKRIARHLWRMGFALLFGTLSFYPGQGRLFPKWLRETNLLHIPAALLACALLWWLYRVAYKRVHNVMSTELEMSIRRKP